MTYPSRTYTADLSLYFVDEANETDLEVDVTVEFTVDQGYPQTYWEPGEPASVDDVAIVTVQGRTWPTTGHHVWIGALMVQQVLDEHYERLVEAAIEQDQPDPDDLRDARIDRELMGWDD